MTAQNDLRNTARVRVVGRRVAALTAGAGTLAFTGAILAAGFGGGAGPAGADALCDQMRAQYGPGWPCISVPTYTPPPTMDAPTPTPGAPGSTGGGPVIGGDAGPGPGTGNGTPIVGGSTDRDPQPRPKQTQVPSTGTPVTGQTERRSPGTVVVAPSPSSAPTPGSKEPRLTDLDSEVEEVDEDQSTVPLPFWIVVGAAAVVGARRQRSLGRGLGYEPAAGRAPVPGGNDDDAHMPPGGAGAGGGPSADGQDPGSDPGGSGSGGGPSSGDTSQIPWGPNHPDWDPQYDLGRPDVPESPAPEPEPVEPKQEYYSPPQEPQHQPSQPGTSTGPDGGGEGAGIAGNRPPEAGGAPSTTQRQPVRPTDPRDDGVQVKPLLFGIDDAIIATAISAALLAAIAAIIAEYGMAWVLRNGGALPNLMLDRIPNWMNASIITVTEFLAKFFAENHPEEQPENRPPYEGNGDSPPARPDYVPKDWEVRRARNGKGWTWQRPGAKDNADSVRIMEPDARYPNGYARIYNEHGQPIDLNGKPSGKGQTHIPLRPDGTFDLPKGWNP